MRLCVLVPKFSVLGAFSAQSNLYHPSVTSFSIGYVDTDFVTECSVYVAFALSLVAYASTCSYDRNRVDSLQICNGILVCGRQRW